MIDMQDLKDGEFYLFKPYVGHMTKAKCNISPRGDEVWFTDKNNSEVAGRAIKLHIGETTTRDY